MNICGHRHNFNGHLVLSSRGLGVAGHEFSSVHLAEPGIPIEGIPAELTRQLHQVLMAILGHHRVHGCQNDVKSWDQTGGYRIIFAIKIVKNSRGEERIKAVRYTRVFKMFA